MNTKAAMKRINCPKCGLMLGVPSKAINKPFVCPKCQTSIEADQLVEVSENQLPFPDIQTPSVRKTPSLPEAPIAPAIRRKDETDSESVPKPGRSNTTETQSKLKSKPKTVARIIPAKTGEQILGNEGALPTLQLKDNRRPTISTSEIRKTPLFLALLICSSLLTSGMVIFLANQQSVTNEAVLTKARVEIARFYQTRIDVDLKPYQLELREAQLAHSRGDRTSEIAAYRKVMARFHAEDRNQFVGVTGSPVSDKELEQLVSTMLRGR